MIGHVPDAIVSTLRPIPTKPAPRRKVITPAAPRAQDPEQDEEEQDPAAGPRPDRTMWTSKATDANARNSAIRIGM